METSALNHLNYRVLMNGTYNDSINTTSVILSEGDQLMLDIERALKVYYSTFLVTVGSVFNILSIVILSRGAFRNSTTSVYLRFLACVDMFVLYNGLSRHFVSGVSGYNIRNLDRSFCKFNQWSSSFAPDISAWILVAVTTERVVSIVWPHKVRTVCSKTTAAVVVTIICLVIMASNVPLLVFYGDKQITDPVTNVKVTQKCVLLSQDYETFMATIWYWLDLLKFVLLPSSILIFFNILIIVFVIRSRKRVEKLVSRRASNNWKTFETSFAISSENTFPRYLKNFSVNNRIIGSNKEVSLTITLLVINATFVICNTPIMVYLLGSEHWFPPGFLPAESLTLTASVMAMYTNNAANFLLYCATGSRFRAEIRHMFASVRSLGASFRSSSRNRNHSLGSDGGRSFRLEDQLATVMGSRETCYTYH